LEEWKKTRFFLKDFFGEEEVFKYFFQKSRGNFLQWYFNGAGSKYREDIQARLEKTLSPLGAKLKTLTEKAATEQLNRQRKKVRSKSTSSFWSNFAEFEQKRKQDEQNSQTATCGALKFLREERWKGCDGNKGL